MRIKSLMLKMLAAAAFVASVSVSCSEISFIEINPPADLQSQIDSIQHVKDSLAALQGDKQTVEITTKIVGAEDCSTGWDGATSQDFTIPVKKMLNLVFVNHGSTANNWNNWNLRVKDAAGAEVFLLRADAYALVKNDPNAEMVFNYPDVDGDGDIWNDFRVLMNGAVVEMKLDHSMAGQLLVDVVATATDGTVFTISYVHAVSATEDVIACLVCDGSWFEMQEAYLTPSSVAEVFDEVATAITVTGTPAAIEVGTTDFWGNGVATVTFADGTSTPVDTADVSFVLPDLATVGTKTIIYSYSKTKLGAYGPSVAGYYTLEVVNPIVKLEPADLTVELVGGAKYFTLAPGNMNVKATYSDGSSSILPTDKFTISQATFEGKPGTYEYSVSTTTASGDVITGSANVTAVASEQAAQDPKIVGLEDNTTPWWAHFSKDWTVAPNTSVAVSMKLNSAAGANFHSPCTIARKADMSEYGVVRMDHYGWGASVGDACALITATSNWNWDTFLPNLNNSDVAITVTNNGDNTASIRYHVVFANGETHFQYYDGIAIDSADFQFAIVVESAHLIFD